MKNLIIAIALTLSFAAGFSSVSAAELSNSSASSTQTGTTTYVRVVEDGAIWVYVYQDGTFVSKYVEQSL